MLTRKGLQALAEGIADGAYEAGADRRQAHEVAGSVVAALRAAGAVTPHYDGEKFTAALDEALHRRGVRLARFAA